MRMLEVYNAKNGSSEIISETTWIDWVKLGYAKYFRVRRRFDQPSVQEKIAKVHVPAEALPRKKRTNVSEETETETEAIAEAEVSDTGLD